MPFNFSIPKGKDCRYSKKYKTEIMRHSDEHGSTVFYIAYNEKTIMTYNQTVGICQVRLHRYYDAHPSVRVRYILISIKRMNAALRHFNFPEVSQLELKTFRDDDVRLMRNPNVNLPHRYSLTNSDTAV